MLRRRLLLLNNIPPWLYAAYATVGTPSCALHFDQGYAWNGVSQVPFSALLSCTNSTGGYVTNADRSLTFVQPNTLRIGAGTGLLVEQASTDVASHANARDFTNAVWVKLNITAAKDQVGADGTANGASSLTATSNGGTVLQTPGLGLVQRTFSLYIKRITGTGTVKVTADGTNYSADLSSSLTTTGYYRAIITATVVPIIGVQLGTSGDAVAVDFAQLEALAFATSAIPAASASRSADVVTLINQAQTAALNAKAAFFKTANSTAVSSSRILTFNDGPSFLFISVTNIRANDGGSNSATATVGAGTNAGVALNAAFAFGGTGFTARANGGALASNANPFGTLAAPVSVGARPAGTASLNGYMLRAAFDPTKGMFDPLAIAP